MWRTALWVLIVLLLPGAGRVTAETVSEPRRSFEELIEEVNPGATLIHLSLQDCIATGLKNNLDIEVEGYFPAINDAVLQSEKGIFDPHLYFNTTYFHGNIPLPTSASIATGGLTGVKVKQWILTGGLAGAIPTGLTYDASILSEHTPFSTTTDFFDADG